MRLVYLLNMLSSLNKDIIIIIIIISFNEAMSIIVHCRATMGEHNMLPRGAYRVPCIHNMLP